MVRVWRVHLELRERRWELVAGRTWVSSSTRNTLRHYLPLTKLWFCVRDGVNWEAECLAQNFEGCLKKRNRIGVKNLDASLEERTSVQTESRDPRRPTFLSGFVATNIFCHRSTCFGWSQHECGNIACLKIRLTRGCIELLQYEAGEVVAAHEQNFEPLVALLASMGMNM